MAASNHFPALYDLLEKRLTGASRLVILSAGSFQKADDAAGVIITEELKQRLGGFLFDRLAIYTGECAPENFTGEIKKFNPSHMIVLDAADTHEKPGNVTFIQPEVIGGISFSTHILPLKIIIEYLVMETGCDMTIIGIQPHDITYGGEITHEVKEAIDDTIDAIEKVIKSLRLV